MTEAQCSEGSARVDLPYYMVVPEVDMYRWVGRTSDAEGLMLAKVRHAPVADSWSPVAIDWVPETKNRLVCDFPIFHPIVRCCSRRASEVLSGFLTNNVELLPLVGLDDEYVGIHCINWLDGAHVRFDRDDNIHSTMYLPTLRRQSVAGCEVFGVREMVTKLFVSARFRDAVIAHQLTGLEFHEVPLC